MPEALVRNVRNVRFLLLLLQCQRLIGQAHTFVTGSGDELPIPAAVHSMGDRVIICMAEQFVLLRLNNFYGINEGSLRFNNCAEGEEVNSCTPGTFFQKCSAACDTTFDGYILFVVVKLG